LQPQNPPSWGFPDLIGPLLFQGANTPRVNNESEKNNGQRKGNAAKKNKNQNKRRGAKEKKRKFRCSEIELQFQ